MIHTNFLVGRTRTLRELIEKDGFDAVFVGTGAGLPKFMGVEGRISSVSSRPTST